MIAQTHGKIFSEAEDTRGLVVRVFVAWSMASKLYMKGMIMTLLPVRMSQIRLCCPSHLQNIGKSGNIDTYTKGVGGEGHDSQYSQVLPGFFSHEFLAADLSLDMGDIWYHGLMNQQLELKIRIMFRVDYIYPQVKLGNKRKETTLHCHPSQGNNVKCAVALWVMLYICTYLFTPWPDLFI